ncbi:MAG TPA: YncE family protein [Ktedonobacteraceae bacterium]|nr:YncE family protein [Ktedonobacteraceae bacterium]
MIDIAKQRVIRTISEPGDPHTIFLSLDGSALYVTQPSLGQVAVLEAKSGKTICSVKLPGQPSLLALSLDYTVLYAAGQGDTSVRALNPQNCSIERTFQTHEPVFGMAVAASTAANATPSTPNQIWITGTSSITIFDTTGQLLGTIPIAGGPQYISIPGGFTAYVTTRQGTVVAVDLNSQRVIQTLLSGGQFGPMDYDAITGEVYVPDLKHNQLDVLAPIVADTTVAQQEPAQIIHLKGTPQSVAITSDGQLGFVALANGQVLMLDIPSRTSVTSITVGGIPHFIITGLYPPVNTPVITPQQPTSPSQGTQPFIGVMLLILSLVLLGILLLGILWFIWRNLQKQVADEHSAKHKKD